MTRIPAAVAFLTLLLGSAGASHAQAPVASATALTALPDLSPSRAGKLLQHTQDTANPPAADPPTALQVVVQFLELRPEQLPLLAQLLQARQVLVAPLLSGVQQRLQQVDTLLAAGGDPADVGVLVSQVYLLRQQIAQAQQGFLGQFVALLDQAQQQRLAAIATAAQVQPVLPAFQQLYLF